MDTKKERQVWGRDECQAAAKSELDYCCDQLDIWSFSAVSVPTLKGMVYA
jgi:hypothetical protein